MLDTPPMTTPQTFLLHSLAPVFIGPSRTAKVAASSLKSALRKAERNRHCEQGELSWSESKNDQLTSLFGASAEQPGQVQTQDAEIVALPMRTSKGGFVWVSSISQLSAEDIVPPKDFEALVHPQNPCLVSDTQLLLEDHPFQAKIADNDALWQQNPSSFWNAERQARRVFVNHAQWLYFLQYHITAHNFGTQGTPHIQFAIPPESLLKTALNAPSDYTLPGYVTLGGHLSVGSGLCQIHPQEAV